jgi:hypothetical protein
VRRYLDDFLLVLPPRSPIEEHSARFQSLCKRLGFSEAEDKREDGTCVYYLGLILDTDKMEARVPEEKINQAIADINKILEYTFVPMKKLQELLGLLEFCVAVFPIGRPFLRHIWNMLCGPETKTKKLSKAARYNLSWWKKFLPIWSGTSVIQSTREKVYVATDASGTKGIGGIEFQTSEVFSTRIPRRHRRKHINWKEMYSILYAFASWSDQWENKKVIIFCDNTGVVHGINKHTIRGKAIEPLQTIFLLAA